MSDAFDKVNPLFLQLVLSLQSAAMFQMGKTASPVSGKIEKDMTQAQISIDLLVMIQQKTRGNLMDEEKRILDATISNLQMNFLDELEKDKGEANKEDSDKAKEAPDINEAENVSKDTSENK